HNQAVNTHRRMRERAPNCRCSLFVGNRQTKTPSSFADGLMLVFLHIKVQSSQASQAQKRKHQPENQ
ncbi:MAG: hypothetical protein AAF597_14865, partial [Bacteroidota bacterium]